MPRADALKLFPAEGASPQVLRAMRAVLPPGSAVLPVGGIDASNFTGWRAAGAAGYGIGSAVYSRAMLRQWWPTRRNGWWRL